jgi:hypothetical protein
MFMNDLQQRFMLSYYRYQVVNITKQVMARDDETNLSGEWANINKTQVAIFLDIGSIAEMYERSLCRSYCKYKDYRRFR